MNFAEYVKTNGSETASLTAGFRSFPSNGGDRELLLFMCSHRFDADINSELLDLQGNYWTEKEYTEWLKGGGNGESTKGERLYAYSKRNT